MQNIQNKSNHRGFTLVEILVVIAIIGILSSVVLGSLNSAREKGADGAVKSNLASVKNAAAIYYDDQAGSYLGLCSTDQKVIDAMASSETVVAPTPTVGGLGDGECVDSSAEWAAWVNLKLSSTSAWCVDSAGKSGEIVVQDSTAVDLLVCP